MVKVALHALGLTGAECAAGVLGETFGHPGAFVVAGVGGDVCLKPGVAQSFAGAVGECGDSVGGDAKDGGEVGGLHPFNFGVPQDRTPFRQGAKSGGDVFAVVDGVGGVFPDVGQVRGKCGGCGVLPCSDDVAGEDVQVGAEGTVNVVAVFECGEKLGEAFLGDVFGVTACVDGVCRVADGVCVA